MPSHFTHQKETNFDSQGPSPGSSGITYHLHDMTISYLLHNFLWVFLVSWNLGSWLISWSLVLDTVSTYPPCCIHHGHSCYTQCLPILLVTSIVVTHVIHSVYLSLRFLIGHQELNFPFLFLTHYHYHRVYQCHLCQPLNHILLNVYSVNHVCSVYAHSSLLRVQIISGPDGSSIRP